METYAGVLSKAFQSALGEAFEKAELPVQQHLSGFYEKKGIKRGAVKTRIAAELVRVLSEELSQKFLSLKIDEIKNSNEYKSRKDQKREETYVVLMSLDLTPPAINLKPSIDFVVKSDGAEIERFSYKFELSIEAVFDKIKLDFRLKERTVHVTLGPLKGTITITGETNGWPFTIAEATLKVDLPYSVEWRYAIKRIGAAVG